MREHPSPLLVSLGALFCVLLVATCIFLTVMLVNSLFADDAAEIFAGIVAVIVLGMLFSGGRS